jgi:hypothetical protein
MVQLMKAALVNVLAVVLYGSAFVIWPICVLFFRRKSDWKRVRRLFFSCLATQLILAGFALLPFRILEHRYYWFFLMIVANLVFTVLGLIAFGKDLED